MRKSRFPAFSYEIRLNDVYEEAWENASKSKQTTQQKRCMNGIGRQKMRWSERDFHILWLAKEGKTPQVIAEQLGYTAHWVRILASIGGLS
jgi:hypothetical protein